MEPTKVSHYTVKTLCSESGRVVKEQIKDTYLEANIAQSFLAKLVGLPVEIGHVAA